MPIEENITQIISTTLDPLLGLTVAEMGLKQQISISNEKIKVGLEAGFPTHSLEKTFLPQLKAALQHAFPKHQIQTTLNFFISAHRTQLVGKSLRGVKNTIAVASGKGGVGKSTVTVNLAAALAYAGARVGILDADIYGPSIPLMLGKTEPVQWKDNLYQPVSAHGIQAMSIGYLTDSEQALIWRGPMLAKSLLQMINMTYWNELDYLLIDLPPGTGDIQLSLVQKIPLTGAVIVTTPQTVATLDAQKALKMFQRTNIDTLGLIENMSYYQCEQCNHQEAIFGTGGAQKICAIHATLLLGQLPLHSKIRSQSDAGIPIATQNTSELASPFIKVALNTAVALSKKPLNVEN